MSTTSIGTATGNINVAGDHDWIKTVLSANTLYSFTSDLTIDLGGLGSIPGGLLAVYDADGHSVGQFGTQLAFMPKVSGTYYVDVSGLPISIGEYTLTLASSPDDYFDNTATTGTMAVDGSATGSLNLAGDSDWFKTTLTANQLYELSADYTVAMPGDVAWVSIFDADGNFVSSFDSAFMPAATGIYYLGVSGNAEGDYTLHLNESPDDFTDNTTTAGTIAVGGSAAGNIDIEDDQDWFKTTLSANQLYSLTADYVESSESDTPYVSVYDENGAPVSFAEASFMPASSGIYYIGVSGTSTGSYTLNLAEAPDDYTDNTATTGTIAVGESATGLINLEGERDWFKTTLVENTLYALTAHYTDEAVQDVPSILIYDENGEPVEALGSGFMPAVSGTYYVSVGGGTDGAYTVDLAVSPDDYTDNTSTSGTIAVGGNAEGVFNLLGDADWFKTTLEANTLYAITSDSTALLTIYDADGHLVGKTDAFGVQLGFMPEVAGSYYIGIRGLADSGNYTLNLEAVDDDYANNPTTTGTIETGVVLNTPPTLAQALADQTTAEDSAFSFQIPNDSFTDADVGDILTYSAILVDGMGETIGTGALPTWLAFDPATQTFSGTPENGDVGELNVKVLAADSQGAGVSDIFMLTVGNVNDAPVASDVTVNDMEDAASVKVTLQGSDVDSVVQYKLLSLPANGALYSDVGLTMPAVVDSAFTGSELYFVPNADWNGSTDFSYQATDGEFDSAAKTVTINISAVPDAPIAQDVSVNGLEDAASITIQLASNNSAAVYKAVSLPANGTLYEDAALTVAVAQDAALADATLYFVPDHNWNGDVSFEYTAADGELASEAKTVDIMVAPVNDLPTGTVSISGTASEGQTLTADNTLDDADGIDIGGISYQWLRNGSPIAGAGAETYVVSQNDLGQNLSVRAGYTDGSGTHEAVVSNALLILPSVNVDGQPVKGVLKGTGGNDVFDSASASAAKFDGGKGDDAYIIHDAGIKIKEAGKQGSDTVYSDVSYTLPNNVENLILTGTANIDGKGNTLNNVLIGNAGNNTLNGWSGNDKLTGGAGLDRFVLDSRLNAKKNVDTITDFTSGEDKIVLKSSLFKKLGDTVDAADVWFKDSGEAQGKTGYLVYDASTGVLAYDKDGSGKAAAVQIALIGIQTHEDLQVSDFVMMI